MLEPAGVLEVFDAGVGVGGIRGDGLVVVGERWRR